MWASSVRSWEIELCDMADIDAVVTFTGNTSASTCEKTKIGTKQQSA